MSGFSCAILAALLSSCVAPLTRPPGLACGARLPLHEPVDPTAAASIPTLLDDTIAIKRRAAPGGQVVVTILALSGGGKYGAFGAGFLAGWSEAERNGQIVPIRREEVDIVTGISTGALLASFAAAGNQADPQERARADRAAQAAYQASDRDLIRKKGMLAALTSNGLVDPKGLLDIRVANSVAAFRDDVARLPDGHKVLIGATNLTNGKFYVADMREVARNGAAADACYTEWLLASAAVPASFPPRFIDGHGYVDGGVRFGAFLGNDVQRVVRRTRAPGDPLADADVRVNLIALFNNPVTANSPARDPAAALACDRSTLATAARDCPAVKNKLIDLALRSAGDIMTHQVYLDSLYRLQRELEAAGILGLSKFIYAAPAQIAAKGCRATTSDQFDRGYMDCLYQLGYEIAQDPARWQNFDTVPRGARANERR
ncbi:patatin-like phospholipase family protein [Sphingomonas quercus]|uniref:Patatin-like phospholipase family protein n=1 Tax=Sphingomonas quercus TaxID=2842451 RepID=A0ABS6BIF5_9SPHN|nr:patatin-like phospholipase family protein [Sphingomonas quercus]MBU3078088.1 patatin-like phospholipase family protein [Sphingomonas quercus]